MSQREIKTSLNRETRKDFNHNYTELYRAVNNMVGYVTDQVLDEVIESSRLYWQEPVPSFDELPIDPETGETRMVKDTGEVYRYDGVTWVEIEQIDARPINEVDERLTDQIEETNRNLSDRGINIKAFGASVDAENNTPFIQGAIDYVHDNGGGIVWIPAGEFIISTSLQLKTNVEVRGTVASVLRKNNGGYVFQATGSVDEEIPISAEIMSGDTTVETKDAHGLTVGDLVILKSQRSAFSDDASDLWRLGGSTAGTNAAYFGEFLVVSRIDSGSAFQASSGVIYTDYFPDDSNETDDSARASATIQRVRPISNAKVSGLTVTGNVSGVINVRYGFNVVTENLNCFVEEDGAGIVFRESFKCHDNYSSLRYSPNHTPSDHYRRNPFKVISSQNCGFNGTYGEYATQTFDFTFIDYSIVTTYPYFNNGATAYSDMNAGTSHGGVYAASVKNNQFMNCRQYGVSIRARNSTISGNIIQGSHDGTYSYGVALYEGWAVNCIVSNNQISGFNKAVTHIDGSESNKFFGWMGTQIIGNSIRGVNRAFMFDLAEANVITESTGVSIMNNTVSDFHGTSAKGVSLTGVNGATVAYNVFNDPDGVVNAGVYLSTRGTDNRVINNDFNNIYRHLWVDDDLVENIAITYESSKSYGAGNIRMPSSGVSTTKMLYGTQSPRVDDTFALGWSGGRWKQVWASSGTISTSDERKKQQIENIPDEWLNAWSEVDYVRYKFNESVTKKGEDARWHVGVVAQQIYEAFDRHGLDAFDIGLLCYDSWVAGDTGETRDLWSIRADECHFMEMALMRRELNKLQ